MMCLRLTARRPWLVAMGLKGLQPPCSQRWLLLLVLREPGWRARLEIQA